MKFFYNNGTIQNSISFSDQCDQIGLFLKGFDSKSFLQKLSKYWETFWNLWNTSLSSKTHLWLLIGQVLGKFGLHFNLTSGHSVSDEERFFWGWGCKLDVQVRVSSFYEEGVIEDLL